MIRLFFKYSKTIPYSKLLSSTPPNKVKLSNGKTADFIIEDQNSNNEKDKEELTNALNFVLSKNVLFHETSSCVHQANLPNDIRVKLYIRSFEAPLSALIISRNNSKLYYEYNGDWLTNWEIKLRETPKS